MPDLFNNAGGFGGFAGFATTAQRKPRQVTGDGYWDPRLDTEVNSGNYAFPTPVPSAGGSRSPAPTPAPAMPRSTPRPTVAPTPARQAPDFYEDERGVFKNSPSATIFPDGPDYAGFRGDEFYSGDFGTPREPTYSSTPGAETARLEPSFLFGQPSVEVLTASGRGSAGNLDTEPSLFPQGGTNPFDEWWKATPQGAPSVTVNAGDTGGSIWAGDDTLGNFGNNLALGSDLSADLGSLGYGEDYPATETAVAESPFSAIADSSGIPVEPDPLNQDVGDTEWTTSPEDRRFLPGSEPESIEPTPTRSLTLGPSLRNFGGQSFGTPLSLGAFLNTPLESLRYGEGYEIPFGGRPRDLQAGEGYIDPQSQSGGHWVDEPGGQRWVEAAPGSTGFSGGNTASSGNRPVNSGTGTQPATAFSDPDTYYEGTYFDYGTGHYQALHDPGSFSDNPNQGAEQSARSPVKFGMNPAGDEGHGVFNTGSGFSARLHPEGGFEMVSSGRDWRTPAEKRYGIFLSNLRTSARGRAQTAGPDYGGTGG